MLKLENVCARYETTSGYVNSVDNVSFEVRKNEIMGIAGESGCGKSTLLKTMYDMVEFPLEICGGSVTLETETQAEKKILTSGEIKKEWWKAISYVPQGAMHVMNPVRKVRTQFLDVIPKEKRVRKEEQEKQILSYLKELELPKEVLDAYPHQLSGGMRQRVIIALATFLGPELVLADEPTTALDVVVQRGILTMLSRVQKKLQNSMVIVSHDMGVHYQITDRLGIMYAGQMIEDGPTEEIFERPRHPYTQMLIGALPRLGDDTQKEGIPGLPPSLKNPPKGCRFAARCPKATEKCRTIQPQSVSVGERHRASCHLLTEEGAR